MKLLQHFYKSQVLDYSSKYTCDMPNDPQFLNIKQWIKIELELLFYMVFKLKRIIFSKFHSTTGVFKLQIRKSSNPGLAHSIRPENGFKFVPEHDGPYSPYNKH